MRGFLFAVCLGLAVPAIAQPGCLTVMLPDLGPDDNVPLTGGIATGFLVPPAASQLAGAFYPFTLYSEANGTTTIEQFVGAKPKRVFSNVASISLVYWLSFYENALPMPLTFVGYKTLVNSVPLGTGEPTWAFRITQKFDRPLDSQSLSTPVQLGEQWNVSIENPLPYPVWANLQIEARICR